MTEQITEPEHVPVPAPVEAGSSNDTKPLDTEGSLESDVQDLEEIKKLAKMIVAQKVQKVMHKLTAPQQGNPDGVPNEIVVNPDTTDGLEPEPTVQRIPVMDVHFLWSESNYEGLHILQDIYNLLKENISLLSQALQFRQMILAEHKDQEFHSQKLVQINSIIYYLALPLQWRILPFVPDNFNQYEIAVIEIMRDMLNEIGKQNLIPVDAELSTQCKELIDKFLSEKAGSLESVSSENNDYVKFLEQSTKFILDGDKYQDKELYYTKFFSIAKDAADKDKDKSEDAGELKQETSCDLQPIDKNENDLRESVDLLCGALVFRESILEVLKGYESLKGQDSKQLQLEQEAVILGDIYKLTKLIYSLALIVDRRSAEFRNTDKKILYPPEIKVIDIMSNMLKEFKYQDESQNMFDFISINRYISREMKKHDLKPPNQYPSIYILDKNNNVQHADTDDNQKYRDFVTKLEVHISKEEKESGMKLLNPLENKNVDLFLTALSYRKTMLSWLEKLDVHEKQLETLTINQIYNWLSPPTGPDPQKAMILRELEILNSQIYSLAKCFKWITKDKTQDVFDKMAIDNTKICAEIMITMVDKYTKQFPIGLTLSSEFIDKRIKEESRLEGLQYKQVHEDIYAFKYVDHSIFQCSPTQCLSKGIGYCYYEKFLREVKEFTSDAESDFSATAAAGELEARSRSQGP